MKLIHCADLHLDAKMTALLDPEQAKERRAEILQTFLRMVDYAEKEGVQAILICGDLFDRRKISAMARNTVLKTIVGHPEISFFYITGNHEQDGFLESIQEKPDNLKLFGKNWKTYEAGPLAITGADPGDGTALDLCRSLVLDPSCFNIVMLHGQITEYGTSEAEEIPLRELRGKPVDYLALGHVHAYQEGTFPPRGTWCYPGCLEGRGFDECGEHGFVLLDIDTEQHRFTKRFIPLAQRRFLEIPVDITGCLTTPEIAARIEETIRELRQQGYAKDDLWKLILCGVTDIACEKEVVYLQKRFSAASYYVRVEDATRLVVDYSGYARDASLKGEFVRQVEMAAELDEQEKAAIIRCGIQALSGEELTI